MKYSELERGRIFALAMRKCGVLTLDELDRLLRVPTTVSEAEEILIRNDRALVVLDKLWEEGFASFMTDPLTYPHNLSSDSVELPLGCPHCRTSMRTADYWNCKGCGWQKYGAVMDKFACLQATFGGYCAEDPGPDQCVSLGVKRIYLREPSSGENYLSARRFLQGHVDWALVLIEIGGIEAEDE